MATSLRSMPCRATGASPNPNELLMAVYGSSMGESNGAVEEHTAYRAPMSESGYKRTFRGLHNYVRFTPESGHSEAQERLGLKKRTSNVCFAPESGHRGGGPEQIAD